MLPFALDTLKSFNVFQIWCNFIDAYVQFVREAGLRDVYNVMEVATEVVTKEAMCNFDWLLQTLVLLPLYIFCACYLCKEDS